MDEKIKMCEKTLLEECHRVLLQTWSYNTMIRDMQSKIAELFESKDFVQMRLDAF